MVRKITPAFTAACACVLLQSTASARPVVESIGPLPATFTFTPRVTGCGDPACQTVMLTLVRSANPSDHAFRWSAGTGFTDIAVAMGVNDMGVATLSHDGTTYVGGSSNGGPLYHWAPPAAPAQITFPAGVNYRYSTDISADGSTLAGVMSNTPNGNGSRGFIWTAATGVVDLNLPATIQTVRVGSISPDGLTVVGDTFVGTQRSGFRWTASGTTFLNGVGGAPVI